ncbi:hypothetical protein DO021_19625 [Desulfobacter hydrogenophilus]|uniref:Uncharacterized protein n=1 Tax=Desulfobacter hydrogenophilus TaxID=2291 RepID=A0A328F7H9_9BACT|nr:hypothetical protein [Desulfobacter hydrogenophilus]NDY73982.1 hypothetical protein [Desulfobacter hydrogenophilus]QBH14327.1 hypothetical protein EYB58_16225 [Desulfobacter hydrogenophilus]RAM00329.1 hypothetical protein DO021_19625 [Desulfobacter hydrogenophilus]
MRTFAKTVITEAAVRAGLPETAVMDQPDRETLLLPEKRLQLGYLTQLFARKPRRIARMASTENPGTYRTLREAVYETTLTIRADVRSDDEAWLESFVGSLLMELPYKIANADNNLVRVQAVRAVRGGFASKTVEVFTKRANALHITFTGLVCRDSEVPLIKEVNFF